MMNGVAAHSIFPPLERVRIEALACTPPATQGLELSRWDCRSLQQVVVETGIVEAIHYTTVAHILAEASLQPHRSRFWKTARLDAQFVSRATRVLWCYERVEWLFNRQELVLCVDEKPNIQAVSRCPAAAPVQPGRIHHREFEYQRHGTAIFLVAFNVFDGTMWGTCLEHNDHHHFLQAMGQLSRRFAWARRIHLIMDNGSSHIDHHTQAYFQQHPRWRVLFTPAHASWLNQAELLLRAFSDKYLNRFDAVSRQVLIDHLDFSWPEYNARFAHPFKWSWTRRNLRDWAESQMVICSKTYATVH